jgi:hypothetical protein
MVEDLLQGSDNSNPLNLSVSNNRLFLVARQSYADGYQLFQYDNATGSVQQISPPSYLSDACVDNDLDAYSVLSATLNMLIYPAFYDSAGMELYKLNTYNGIEESEMNLSFSLFPNPASNTISMMLPDSQEGVLGVFDMKGAEIMNKNLQGRKKLVLDMSDYPCGVYIVRLTTSEVVSVKKFIKQISLH